MSELHVESGKKDGRIWFLGYRKMWNDGRWRIEGASEKDPGALPSFIYLFF